MASRAPSGGTDRANYVCSPQAGSMMDAFLARACKPPALVAAQKQHDCRQYIQRDNL